MKKRKNALITTLSIFLLFCCDITDSEEEQIDWTKGKVIVTANDSDIPDSVRSWYQEDAARLALRDVHAIESAKKTLIEIPVNLIKLYYNGSVHVYNATSLAARDSVVEIYIIHTFPHPETHSLIVAVDSTKDWVNAWKNGERLTGNSKIDRLMETYDLQLDRYYRWPWSHSAVLRALTPLNILALAPQFQNIEGVHYAEPNGYGGDGNDIIAAIESDFLKCEYSVGYGDCPSGCIYRHFWTFHINYDGSVEFVVSFGDPAP